MKKIVFCGWIVSLLFLVGTAPVSAKIIDYRAPGISASNDFQVWAGGQEVFTGQAGSRWPGFYSFTTFDFSGAVSVKVKSAKAIKWLNILPSSLGIQPVTIDDYTFEFKLDEPEDITILLNNDRNNALHILTNRPETERSSTRPERPTTWVSWTCRMGRPCISREVRN